MGIDLLLHFEEAIAFIRKNPYIYAKVLLHFRKALMDKYPYAIYYAINEQEKIVDVYAVLHQSRNPKLFRQRIEL